MSQELDIGPGVQFSNPQSISLLKQAEQCFEKNQLDSCLWRLKQIESLEIDRPRDPRFQTLLARILIGQKRFREAVSLLVKAYIRFPSRILVSLIVDCLTSSGSNSGVRRYWEVERQRLDYWYGNEDTVVLGDSHSRFLFDHSPRSLVMWLGPVTAHRVGRDGLASLKSHYDRYKHVVLVFGEIDIRMHIDRVKQSRGDKGGHLTVIDLATRYAHAAYKIKEDDPAKEVFLTEVIPPSPQSCDFELYKNKIVWTDLFNLELAKNSKPLGLNVLQLNHHFRSAIGCLDASKSDHNVHVSRKASLFVVRQELDSALNFDNR